MILTLSLLVLSLVFFAIGFFSVLNQDKRIKKLHNCKVPQPQGQTVVQTWLDCEDDTVDRFFEFQIYGRTAILAGTSLLIAFVISFSNLVTGKGTS